MLILELAKKKKRKIKDLFYNNNNSIAGISKVSK